MLWAYLFPTLTFAMMKRATIGFMALSTGMNSGALSAVMAHATKSVWKPDVLLGIDSAWEKKRAAIECMEGQEHLWEYYTRVAQQRGAQAARNSDKTIKWGEGFQSVFPHVVETLA